MIWTIRHTFLLGTGLTLLLAGCSTTDDGKYEERPVGVIYNTALDLLKKQSYGDAAKEFDEVERQHPYSKWATQAQLMSAYANYKGQKYETALATLEAFVQLHPAHPDVPYALYMQGMCYYEQLSPSLRDQQDTLKALEIFQDLNARFPFTDYAKDARTKIILLQDALAGKEMEVGRYYQSRRAYAAAINRFQDVSGNYDTTNHVEEALYRTVECYLALGLPQEAKAAASILGHNYPQSPWYAEAYTLMGGTGLPTDQETPLRYKDESWIDRVRNWNKGLPQKPPAKHQEQEGKTTLIPDKDPASALQGSKEKGSAPLPGHMKEALKSS